METWKISWIGELELGWMKFYGSYATRSMFSKGLDQIPYTVGIRLVNNPARQPRAAVCFGVVKIINMKIFLKRCR
jgi:hypothetical protein